MDGRKFEIEVDGMTCGHCEASVVKALEALPGVSDAVADRESGAATFVSVGDIDGEAAARAVQAIGFEARP